MIQNKSNSIAQFGWHLKKTIFTYQLDPDLLYGHFAQNYPVK